MKKYISLWLSVILLAGMLSGCLPSGNPNLASQPTTTMPTTEPTQPKTQPTTVPTQPTTVPTQPEDTTIEVAAQIRFYKYLERFYDATRAEKWPKIINSAEDFKKFLESDYMQTIRSDKYGFSSNDLEILERYDDAFFEENSLVLLCLYDANGNFCGSFGVDSCVKYDGYYDGYFIVSVGVGGFYCGPFWFNTHYIVFIEINEVVEEHAVFYFEIDGDLGIDEIVLGPTGS